MGPTESATILVYCKHPVLTLGIQALFENREDLQVMVTSGTERAVELARSTQPAAFVLDMNSELDLGFLRSIKRQSPASKVVLWIEAISTDLAFQAFNAGVVGIVDKALTTDEFMTSLIDIVNGDIRIEPKLMDAIMTAKMVKLTRRESELVMLVARGFKNKEIGAELSITENTVKAYLSRLFQKLNVKDRLDLALYGLKNLKAPSAPVEPRQPYPFLPPASRVFDPGMLLMHKD